MSMADTAMPFTLPTERPAENSAACPPRRHPLPAAARRTAHGPPPTARRRRRALGRAAPAGPRLRHARRERDAGPQAPGGEPVLPLAFGEAGLPAHPLLRDALAAASGGTPTARWPGCPSCARRPQATGLAAGCPPARPRSSAGPGSKALLFGLLLAIGTDVAVPQPSWVSYAAQAS